MGRSSNRVYPALIFVWLFGNDLVKTMAAGTYFQTVWKEQDITKFVNLSANELIF